MGAVTVLIQWQGPSVRQGPDGDLRRRRVLAMCSTSRARRFQKRLVDSGLWQAIGVNYYTLNQVGPITISGQTTPEQAAGARSRRSTPRSQRFDDPGYFTRDELEAVKAQRAVSTAFGRRARVGVRAHDRLLVERR